MIGGGIFLTPIFGTHFVASPTPNTGLLDTHDDLRATPDEWKKYKKRLEELTEASEKYLFSKYAKTPEISHIDDIDAIEVIDAEAAVLQMSLVDELHTEINNAILLTQAIEEKERIEFFYRELASEIVAEKTRLKILVAKMQQEEDDIHTILMLSGGVF